jgi:CheY-like chemotaxis protein
MASPYGRVKTTWAVDDKRANLLALEAVLGGDYQVVFASSGEEAISLVEKRGDIDLILMDVQMPDLDGFETAARIKQMKERQDIPIIFVTAIYTEDPWIRKGYEVGGIDYFSKPFDPEILKMKVAVYASFRRKADFLKERERHIRESEELLKVGRKLSTLLESLPVGVLIGDAEGRICQTTEEVARILNTADPSDAGSYGELLGWWDSAGRMLKNENGPLARALRGRIVGAVILMQDLTESREIEEALEQRVTQLISIGVELEESAAP